MMHDSDTYTEKLHSSRQHLPGLDGVRGLAILLVMFSHFVVIGHHLNESSPLHRLILSGHLGVDLFFALSGFLITGILIDSRRSKNYFLSFYWRRSLRIFPLYYGTLTIAALSVAFITPGDQERLTGVDSLSWYWLYASNIGMFFKGTWLNQPTWICLGHFWSLAVEEQFYLVWPLIVWLVSAKRLGKVCLWLVLLSPLMHMALHYSVGPLVSYVSTLGRLGELAGGAGLAVLWRNPALWSKLCTWLKPTLIVGAIILLLERSWMPQLVFLEQALALVVGCGMVALAATGDSPISRAIFESRTLRWLGNYSYGIYVYHHAFAPIWEYFIWEKWIKLAITHPLLSIASYLTIATTVSLLLSWLSWKLLEAPILSLKNRFFQRQSEERV